MGSPAAPFVATIDRAGLDSILDALRGRGYACIGPTVRDGAVVLDEICTSADLPAGWTDEQGPGRYRLRRREDGAVFGHAPGPQSWKRFLFPPEERLWTLRRSENGFERVDEIVPERKLAFIGVRGCELRALQIQDAVFEGNACHGAAADPGYLRRRGEVLVIAASCLQPGGTCFCASMGTGPRPGAGHDLLLTEMPEGAFLVETGSEEGRELLEAVSHRAATREEEAAAARALETAARSMKRAMDPDARELLAGSAASPRWAAVGARCLSCGNCTLACPTCFCSSVEDVTDLAGARAERTRRWDSCFSPGFSYLHGGEVRASTAARYRQWITHKLSTWFEQFGCSGCVGCGRCITWCPVGIDITEEVAALRASAAAGGKQP